MTKEGFVSIGSCEIDSTARICLGAVIGKPFRPLLDSNAQTEADAKTIIGPHAYVGYHSVIGAGSTLSDGAIVDDYCSIENDVIVGPRTLVIYRAQICNEAAIGANCVIGGFIAERVVVRDRSRVFGKIVHSQRNPSLGWDDPDAVEESAVVDADAFIGFDALVAGKVVIGTMAYVCAGAIVTRDIPARHVAYGVNRIVPREQWKGPLAQSPFFAQKRGQ